MTGKNAYFLEDVALLSIWRRFPGDEVNAGDEPGGGFIAADIFVFIENVRAGIVLKATLKCLEARLARCICLLGHIGITIARAVLQHDGNPTGFDL